MYQLKTSAAFDSAHFLSGYHGKCSNLHGHHWVVEVVIQDSVLQAQGEKRGMIMDFGDLKNEVRSLAEHYDHALLYEWNTLRKATVDALKAENFRLIELPFRPTAENLAKHFFEQLKAKELPVHSVTVYETPDNAAVFEEEQHALGS